jgi:hypothetical protein
MIKLGLLLLLLTLLFAVPAIAQNTSGPLTMQSAVTTTGEGTSLPSAGWERKTITVEIAAAATVLVQGTIDGTYWETLTTLNASGTAVTNSAFRAMRANVTACAACTVTAKGYLER